MISASSGENAARSPDTVAAWIITGKRATPLALAEPGKAYLTENTATLAEGFLDLDDLGEFEIKGASRPVRVFELAGVGEARSRLDLSRERGFSRFVGRSKEMSILEEALEHAQKAKEEAS